MGCRQWVRAMVGAVPHTKYLTRLACGGAGELTA
jgi:hypothetical protein